MFCLFVILGFGCLLFYGWLLACAVGFVVCCCLFSYGYFRLLLTIWFAVDVILLVLVCLFVFDLVLLSFVVCLFADV